MCKTETQLACISNAMAEIARMETTEKQLRATIAKMQDHKVFRQEEFDILRERIAYLEELLKQKQVCAITPYRDRLQGKGPSPYEEALAEIGRLRKLTEEA